MEWAGHEIRRGGRKKLDVKEGGGGGGQRSKGERESIKNSKRP